jgi:hypothetical protein
MAGQSRQLKLLAFEPCELERHIRNLHRAKVTISHAISYLIHRETFELHSFNILDEVFLAVIVELNRALRVQEERWSYAEKRMRVPSVAHRWW